MSGGMNIDSPDLADSFHGLPAVQPLRNTNELSRLAPDRRRASFFRHCAIDKPGSFHRSPDRRLITPPGGCCSKPVSPASFRRRKKRSVSKIARREEGILQRRYREHAIRDDVVDFKRHITYIHYNSVIRPWHGPDER